MDFVKTIAGRELEYIDSDHLYLVDGVIVPSITQMLKKKFGAKYDMVDENTLQRAAERGTAVHSAIERYCEAGEDDPAFRELQNFKWLLRQYKFEVLKNEIPVILFRAGKPIAAGRLDMVIQSEEGLGIADVKRTSSLDKEYLFYQLNLYRLAYKQDYSREIDFLRAIWLREEKRKYVKIPVNEEMAWEFIEQYQEGINECC